MQSTSREPTEAAAIQLIQKLDESFATGQGINWAITLNGEVIATCGYYRGFKDATGEIGYVMREAFRRKGYMKEAVQEIVDYGFEQLGLKRIRAITKDDNVGSIRLLEGVGFLKSPERDGDYVIFEKLA
jgi:ribosomal-protein-alanine N-acetyltransferase